VYTSYTSRPILISECGRPPLVTSRGSVYGLIEYIDGSERTETDCAYRRDILKAFQGLFECILQELHANQ
jgi:hypothetical protein